MMAPSLNLLLLAKGGRCSDTISTGAPASLSVQVAKMVRHCTSLDFNCEERRGYEVLDGLDIGTSR
jgi:hypothetical protein